jgi:transposase-like protein
MGKQAIIQFTKEGLGIRSTARRLKISKTTLLRRIIAIAKKISNCSLELRIIRFFLIVYLT